MPSVEELIKTIHSNLQATDDLSVLSDWNLSLSTEFAVMAQSLAEAKRERARDELVLKTQIVAANGKYTEKGIERAYFNTDQGRYYVYATEMLRAIGKLIGAIRFKIRMLDNPLQ